MGILADFEFLTKVARPGQWMQVSKHCSSNCFKKQTSTLGLQSCYTLIRSAFSADFEMPLSLARWPTILKFNVVVVEPMPGWFDLGGILWHHCCMLQHHRNIFCVQNSIFAMTQAEIAPDNAATDPLDLEYS